MTPVCPNPAFFAGGFEACRIGSIFPCFGTGVTAVGILCPGCFVLFGRVLALGRNRRRSFGLRSARSACIVSGSHPGCILCGSWLSARRAFLPLPDFLLLGHLLLSHSLGSLAFAFPLSVPVVSAAARCRKDDPRRDPAAGSAGTLFLREIRYFFRCYRFRRF